MVGSVGVVVVAAHPCQRSCYSQPSQTAPVMPLDAPVENVLPVFTAAPLVLETRMIRFP
jgi:hypothetical protein